MTMKWRAERFKRKCVSVCLNATDAAFDTSRCTEDKLLLEQCHHIRGSCVLMYMWRRFTLETMM